MELIQTEFDGLFLIKHKVFEDNRGLFIKTYNETIFKELGNRFRNKRTLFFNFS